MNIIVCVKQVPGSSNVEIDPVTGVLKRDGAKSKMNPYDLYAIETALSLAEKYDGDVTAITMGPPQAKNVIVESICMGAKRGTVISDRKFAGADVLATAYTLAQGIKKCDNFDLVICGKQTTDGDTAQVGAEVSEFLNIPNISNVISVEEIIDGEVYLTASVDEKIIKMSVKTPCLISVDGDINSPRLPSYKVKQGITDDMIKFVSLADFDDKNSDNYGLSGSATQVERLFSPEKNTKKHIIDGNVTQQADALFALLCDNKLI